MYCDKTNTTPHTLTVSREDNVVIGDTRSGTLFVYTLIGRLFKTISLPEGALAVGMKNICTDSQDNIVVATHAKPYRLLRYTMRGKRVSDWPSPANMEQLALTVTAEGVLVIACVDQIIVFDPVGRTTLGSFTTQHLFMVLEADTDKTFAAFDPDKKVLVKYSLAQFSGGAKKYQSVSEAHRSQKRGQKQLDIKRS